jgi:hypothetical protein
MSMQEMGTSCNEGTLGKRHNSLIFKWIPYFRKSFRKVKKM